MFLEGVCVCVNYADFLIHTLPENRAHFDNFFVVTDFNDQDTVNVCKTYNVMCVQTDAFYRDGSVFNKGAGINEGLKHLKNIGWVVHMDADIYLPPMTRYVLERMTLEEDKIYGVDRLMCPSYEEWVAYKESFNPIHELWTFVHARIFPVGSRIVQYNDPDGWIPIGFFQMWHPKTSGVFWYPDQHGAADRTDTLHGKKFVRNKRELLAELLVIHLESEECHMGRNWNGRKTKRFGRESPEKTPVSRSLFQRFVKFLLKLGQMILRALRLLWGWLKGTPSYARRGFRKYLGWL